MAGVLGSDPLARISDGQKSETKKATGPSSAPAPSAKAAKAAKTAKSAKDVKPAKAKAASQTAKTKNTTKATKAANTKTQKTTQKVQPKQSSKQSLKTATSAKAKSGPQPKKTAAKRPPAQPTSDAALQDRVAQALRNTPKQAQYTEAPQIDAIGLKEALAQTHKQLEDLQSAIQATSARSEKERGILRQAIDEIVGFFDPKKSLDFWYEFVLASRSTDIDPFGLDPKFEERVERLLSLLYTHWWRVDAIGIENIPAEGRALLVSNHSGMLPYDGAMIKMAARLEHPEQRRVRFLVENFVFYFPFLGTFVYRFGSVRASQANARMLLEQDQLVAVFPEGVKGLGKMYKQRYQLQRFGRGGFVRLAADTNSDIIPVAVVGAEEIHPMVSQSSALAKLFNVPYFPITPTFPSLGLLGLIPYPTKWSIRFGEPYTVPQAPQEGYEFWLHEESLHVRRRIQELIYLQLQERKSIFFG